MTIIEPSPIACTLAPEAFKQNASTTPSCACATSVSDRKAISKELPGTKAAGVTALAISTGAVACSVCCVLPFALPATIVASTGVVLAWLVKLHVWATLLAIVSVAGAWSWIAWQSRRTGRRPATSTLVMMGTASVLLTLAMLWPLIEKPLIRMLRA